MTSRQWNAHSIGPLDAGRAKINALQRMRGLACNMEGLVAMPNVSMAIFANMFAGHLAILSFIALIFVLSPFFAVVSIPFALFTYLLEVLVALIQALVFTLLSCIFIAQASSVHGEE